MNITVLTGRITRDLELKQTGNGKSWCSFTLAVDRMKNDEADFISCTAWGKTAENMCKYLKQGAKIMLTGRIQTGSYEKEGRKIYTTDVVASAVEFLDGKKEGGKEGGEAEAPDFTVPEEIDDDELPFA